jgi:hypothetical protein
MEAVRTSETSVDNHFTRQYNPEDSSEHHTRRRENLKSHIIILLYVNNYVKEVRCDYVVWIHMLQCNCPVAVSCEHGNKQPNSRKGGKFLDWLRDCQLLNGHYGQWSSLVSVGCLAIIFKLSFSTEVCI